MTSSATKQSPIRPRTKCGGGGPHECAVEGAGLLRASRYLPLPARFRAPPPPQAGEESSSPPENELRGVIVDILDRLVQLDERAAAFDREGFVFLQARIGEAHQPGRDLVGALVEIVGELADRGGRFADVALFVAAAGKGFEAGHDRLEPLR